MKRILVHAGFHKTATSTIEHMLVKNRDRLSKHCAVYGSADLGKLPRLAKWYSQGNSDDMLRRFEKACHLFAKELASSAQTNHLLSSVDLIGALPGLGNVSDYAAAGALLRSLSSSIADLLPDAQITLVMSTRRQEDWLASLWWQTLKVSRLTDDKAQFFKRFQHLSPLNQIAQDIAAQVQPVSLQTYALESAKDHPLGPAGPLLDHFNVPVSVTSTLTKQKPLKVSADPETAALLLEANRSDMSDEDVKRAKSQILQILKLSHSI